MRDYLRLLLHDREYEVFVAILLDAQNRVLATEELFRGTLTQTSVYPREVVRCALAHNAAAILCAHNHPSGVAEPSHADELLTQSLKQALALVDIKVLDHFIVAGSSALSAERGCCDERPLPAGDRQDHRRARGRHTAVDQALGRGDRFWVASKCRDSTCLSRDQRSAAHARSDGTGLRMRPLAHLQEGSCPWWAGTPQLQSATRI